MKKKMIGITAALAAITIILSSCYRFAPNGTMETLVISFGTTLYHFAMRLAVGGFVDFWKHNQWNYRRAWFQEKPYEKQFYEFIKIKKWKRNIPTYVPEQFDLRQYGIEKIVTATCQAEVVHEINMVLSFVPVFLSAKVGSAGVFWITSILAALVDSVFVMLQRYNRPRLMKLIKN